VVYVCIVFVGLTKAVELKIFGEEQLQMYLILTYMKAKLT